MADPKYIPFIPQGKRFNDLAGKRFGRLVAIEPMRRGNEKRAFWRCICECGTITVVVAGSLVGKTTSSCGCLDSDNLVRRNTSHGLSRTRSYGIWSHMIGRCNNPNDAAFHHYGGRGITHDPRWRYFENFWADMGEAPKGLSLDRIDNNGPYSKDNCRWATPKQQARNTRHCRHYNYDGQRLTITELAPIVGIPRGTLNNRLNSGKSLTEAIAWPRHAKRLKCSPPA